VSRAGLVALGALLGLAAGVLVVGLVVPRVAAALEKRR